MACGQYTHLEVRLTRFTLSIENMTISVADTNKVSLEDGGVGYELDVGGIAEYNNKSG